MSQLDLDTFLAHLAAELGQMPTEIVQWAPPYLNIGKRTHPGLRRAIERLAGGGLLAVQVQSSLRNHLGDEDMTTLLAEELQDLHADVDDFQPTRATGDLVVLVQVRAQEERSPEHTPIPEASLNDLDQDMVGALSRHAPPDNLEDIHLWSREERGLLKYGAAVEDELEVVPTVAGLVALGRTPTRFVAGMSAVVHGDDHAHVVGNIEVLPQRIVRALHLPEPAASALRPLVVYALAHGSWSDGDREQPLVVLASGRRVEVRWPEAAHPGNPSLRELLRLRRVDRRAIELKRLRAWVRQRGGRGSAVVRSDGEVRAEMVLPSANGVGPARRRPLGRADQKREPSQPRQEEAASTPMATAASDAATGDTAAPPSPPDPSPFVPAETRETQVLALIDDHGSCTTREIIDELGWTRSTTRDVLARLVRDGSLRRVATSARSPVQAYQRSG